MAETVYRLLPGDGIALEENAGTKTVTISVPGLATKLNLGDIVQATQLQAGIAEIATNAEVQTGTDTDRIVTPAGLASLFQSNSTDATAGRLMRVGAFGLGDAVALAGGSDLNAVVRSGFYRLSNPHVNAPAGTAYQFGQMIVSRGGDTIAQILISYTAGTVYFRSGNPAALGGIGGWSTWREIYHTSNFDPATKANTSGTYSGLSVGNSAQVGGQTAAMLAPPGAICYFATENSPLGWLHANGAAVSRTTYPDLFAAIGTRWGAGNGSSTFNLPDLRGFFLRVADYGRGLDPGRQPGTSQSSANLAHSHSISTDPGHSHTFQNGGAAGGGFARLDNGFAGNTSTSVAGAHSHVVGTDGANESRPINVALLACIKF